MPTFVHSALLGGMLIVGVPVLIHLINMLRHRRVDWAAMEFLLASQRKNRTWIIFKQLLLLLMRMAVIATIVLIVAQPLLRNHLGGMFGGGKTHHILLLDDSFSMSDRWADTAAFDEAKEVIERIGAEAARQVQPQTVTLLRFSRAGHTAHGTLPDLLEEPVGADFVDLLHDTVGPLTASETSAGPNRALEAIGQLLGTADSEHRIVYLISDYRARQWEEADDLAKRLKHLTDSGVKLHLINCVEAARPNLAITSLVPMPGTRAAGVHLFVEVTVKNFGTVPVKDVSVLLEADGNARPSVTIAEIPPGRSAKERFQVNFSTAGEHRITARLQSDSVAADNFRYAILDFPLEVPTLLIDGGAEAMDARFLAAALAPGGSVRTGINPRIETPRYLSLNPLDEFQVIYLANVDRLDASAIEALERYVKAGGGLAVFMGQQCRAEFINEQLYRDGEGFFPLPMTGRMELLVDRLERAPDMQVAEHPIFRIFAGKRNSFISTVMIERYFGTVDLWKPDPDSTTRVIARLRNGAPLAVEQRFGEGRVVVFLTTAAPIWNNWARNNPSFVVVVQELQSYLSERPMKEISRAVGTPLRLEFDPARYKPQVRFATPDEAVAMATIDATPTPDGPLAAALTETDTAGVYEARLTATDETAETRSFAFNVEADEGDLAVTDGTQLATRLEGVPYEYAQAAVFQYAAHELAGYNLSQALLIFLILLLIGEQILAWSASYHPPAVAGKQRRNPSIV